MKKRLLAAAAVIAVLAALGAWLALGAGGRSLPKRAELAPQAERDFLRAELVYDAGTRTLSGRGTLTRRGR